jgi:hypothetical protein
VMWFSFILCIRRFTLVLTAGRIEG